MSLTLTILALGLSVQVEGKTRCPTAVQIEQHLQPLLPRELRGSRAHRATVTRSGNEITLELRERGGALLARRSFFIKASESCTRQAQDVAVILAAWEVRLKSGDLPMPELPASPPPATASTPIGAEAAPVGAAAAVAAQALVSSPGAGAAPTAPAATAASPEPPAAPASTTPGLVPAAAPQPTLAAAPAAPQQDATTVVTPEASAKRSTLTLDLGAGALGSFTGGQLAFGGLVELVMGGEDSPWIGVLSLTAVGQHSTSLESGQAVWSRFALNGGPGLRLRFGSLALEPFLLASVAWVHLSGSGFASTQVSNGYDLGLGGGGRFSVSWRRLRPWVGLTVSDWLVKQTVAVHGSEATATLPSVELLMELGLSFELR